MLAEALRWYDSGVMPYEGAYYDQPAETVEWYEHIRAAFARTRQKAAD